MTSTPLLRRGAAALCVSLGCLAAPAHAETFAIGEVGPGRTSFFDDISHTGPFEDQFTFSVAAGSSVRFSAGFWTPMSNRFWIADLRGELSLGDTVLQSADAWTEPYPFPSHIVSFAGLVLGEGAYVLRVAGTPTAAFPGPVSSYDGTLTFAHLAAPVPEPGLLALMALGCAAVGAAVRRRHRR